MILFWDLLNDDLEVLDDDGEFYFYSEDSVELDQTNGERGRFWTRLEKLTDVTPLNTTSRFEVLDPITGQWINMHSCSTNTFRRVQRLAGVREWWITP